MMTPKEKAFELLTEFSVEKSLDITETMIDAAVELGEIEDINYWEEVKKDIENQLNQ